MKRLLKKLRPNSKGKSKEEGVFYENLKHILKFNPKELSFYEEAFTHSSMRLKGPNGSPINYERLEFLGDAILGSIVAQLGKIVTCQQDGLLPQRKCGGKS
jgi:ribonuclease-3